MKTQTGTGEAERGAQREGVEFTVRRVSKARLRQKRTGTRKMGSQWYHSDPSTQMNLRGGGG